MALFGFKKKKEIKKKEEKNDFPSAEFGGGKMKKISSKNSGLISKILVKPLVTEKSSASNSENKYVFAVAKRANKIEIKKAVEGLYHVRPIKINIIKTKGKEVRYGRTKGRTSDVKKAILTLKQGDKIDIGT